VGRFVLRRVAQSAVVLLGVSLIVFALVHLVPGDPIRSSLGTRFDPQTYEALRERAGFNRPLPVQYVSYVGGALTGDLGVSFRTGQPVTTALMERLPATLSLAAASLAVALLIAVPLGIVSALRSGRPVDHAATVVSQIGVSIPDFWMAILLILLFSGTFGLLPPSGYEPLLQDPVGWAEHIVMPAVTIGVVSGAILTRFIRAAVLESMGEDYVRTARSKGLRERLVLRRHVLRNALIPVITVTGVQLASLLGGVIVVEVIFAWPGLGRLTLDAVGSRDYPVLQGAVLLFAAMFLLVNLLVDLLYAAVDPRIRYAT
jgi:peptide/nickel transport system permease protein